MNAFLFKRGKNVSCSAAKINNRAGIKLIHHELAKVVHPYFIAKIILGKCFTIKIINVFTKKSKKFYIEFS